MSDDRTVTFKLNGKRPDDFTIERLAQYHWPMGLNLYRQLTPKREIVSPRP